jgi:hypothetical protein
MRWSNGVFFHITTRIAAIVFNLLIGYKLLFVGARDMAIGRCPSGSLSSLGQILTVLNRGTGYD